MIREMKSSRDPEKFYSVDLHQKTCDCDSFRYRGYDKEGNRVEGFLCKHLKEALKERE
jgi:hypothetical protein